MTSLLRLRWRLRLAFLADVGTLATQALRVRGLTWRDAARAVLVLAVWTALAVLLLLRGLEVIRGA